MRTSQRLPITSAFSDDEEASPSYVPDNTEAERPSDGLLDSVRARVFIRSIATEKEEYARAPGPRKKYSGNTMTMLLIEH